jgi:ubiquinone/menaquinone biosynthesis C-methylase UbiE
MGPWEIALVFIVLAMALALAYGSTRLRVPRRVGFEGIEDPEMAEAYDRLSRLPQFALFRRGLIGELEGRNPAGTVVDVGCGPGYLLGEMGKRFPGIRLVGIDISEEMVGRARANMVSWGLGERADFRRGEAAALPFEASSQDFIVSTLSLHHWSDPAKALAEFHRVLKPGGQVLVMDLRRDTLRIFYWLILFAQNVALRVLGAGAMTRSGEPLNSLLSSYTVEELKAIAGETPFGEFKVDGRIGWLYLWCRKPPAG